jgi:hypothetical protein
LGQLKYFLAVYKCSSHRANLAPTTAVVGAAAVAAAATGAELDREGQQPHLAVCGAAVRLYKYLINDYFDDFSFATHIWVGKAMLLEPPLPDADQARPPLQARMPLRRPSGALGLDWSQLSLFTKDSRLRLSRAVNDAVRHRWAGQASACEKHAQ